MTKLYREEEWEEDSITNVSPTYKIEIFIQKLFFQKSFAWGEGGGKRCKGGREGTLVGEGKRGGGWLPLK